MPNAISIPLRDLVLHGPLCQFGERLMWLRDESFMAMSDIAGNYTAVISSPGLVGLRTVMAKEPSVRILKSKPITSCKCK